MIERYRGYMICIAEHYAGWSATIVPSSSLVAWIDAEAAGPSSDLASMHARRLIDRLVAGNNNFLIKAAA